MGTGLKGNVDRCILEERSILDALNSENLCMWAPVELVVPFADDGVVVHYNSTHHWVRHHCSPAASGEVESTVHVEGIYHVEYITRAATCRYPGSPDYISDDGAVGLV